MLINFIALFAVVIGNNFLGIEFGSSKEGFPVRSIENRISKCVKFVNHPDKGFDLWHLEFLNAPDANGKRTEASSRSRLKAKERICRHTSDGIILEWKGMDLPGESKVLDVTVRVTLNGKDGSSEWSISIDNRSKIWSLSKTRFPCLPDVTEPGKGDHLVAAAPLGAQLHKGYIGKKDVSRVKFPTCAPPISAFIKDGVGLYVGVHDAARPILSLMYGIGCNFAIEAPVSNAGELGRAAKGPGFSVTVRPFVGDWWQAAKIYREWALQQKWAAKGPIIGRKDFPQSFKDLDVMTFMTDRNARSASNKIARIVKGFPGLKVGVHWYGWYNSGFCVNFPELFPAQKGVAEVVKTFVKDGVMVMPYTNPRLWDTNSAAWEFTKDYACRWWNGEYPTVSYQGNPCAVMCPSSEKWKRSVWKWSRRLLDEIGVNAIYYDQVAVARPFECYDTRHGHPVGGGNWWTDGYRCMLEPMHRLYSSRNAPITSELAGDQWLDLIDGYMLCGSPRDDEVPFFPAVYSGYAIYFGSEENMCDSDETFESWQYRQFAWGVLPGWFDRWDIGESRFNRQREMIVRLAKIRRVAEDYMVYGMLEDEVRFTDPLKEKEYPMNYLWRPTAWPSKVHMYDLHGTVWKSRKDGSRAIVVANASSNERKVSFRLPCNGFKVVDMEETSGCVYSEFENNGTLFMKPHGIAFLRTK
jgi:hypothetical protein